MTWPTTRLKNVSRVQVSNVNKKSVSGEQSVRLCNYVDVYKNDLITSDMEFMGATASFDQARTFRICIGDTLITKDSETADDIAVPAYVIDTTAGLLCGYHLAMVRPTSQIDPKYLYWSLASTVFQQQMTASATGITRFGLRQDVIGNGMIHLPPADEQRRIADFLDAQTQRLESLRRQTEVQQRLLDNHLIELFRTRTTTEDRQQEERQTGIHWMPRMAASWRLLKIGHMFLTGSGTTPRVEDTENFDGPHRWVNTGDLRDTEGFQPRRTVTDTALSRYPTLTMYDPGALVVAMYGATVGRTGILGVRACVNQACCVLSEYGDLTSSYTFYWLRAHRDEIIRLALGGGQPNISQELVRSLRVPAPDKSRQCEIVRSIRAVEEHTSTQRRLLQRRTSLLAERRRALVTAAVTGEIDVTTARGVEVS